MGSCFVGLTSQDSSYRFAPEVCGRFAPQYAHVRVKTIVNYCKRCERIATVVVTKVSGMAMIVQLRWDLL